MAEKFRSVTPRIRRYEDFRKEYMDMANKSNFTVEDVPDFFTVEDVPDFTPRQREPVRIDPVEPSPTRIDPVSTKGRFEGGEYKTSTQRPRRVVEEGKGIEKKGPANTKTQVKGGRFEGGEYKPVTTKVKRVVDDGKGIKKTTKASSQGRYVDQPGERPMATERVKPAVANDAIRRAFADQQNRSELTNKKGNTLTIGGETYYKPYVNRQNTSGYQQSSKPQTVEELIGQQRVRYYNESVKKKNNRN